MHYTEEFKIQVIKKYIEENKTQMQVSRETGVSVSSVRNWIRSYNLNPENPFVGSGRTVLEVIPEYENLKMIKDLQEENAILKKALAIFAREK